MMQQGRGPMRQTDIAIVGGGLAGSLAAAMLGRAGHRAIMIDPHAVYPPDFRCEKLDSGQAAILRKTGLADAVLRAATHDRECWVARRGRVIEKRPSDQHGIMYDTLVNTIRAEIPPGIEVVIAKVSDLATSRDRQTVTLSNGEQISARLVVLANGLNIGLRHKLGMSREIVSAGHSISIGFDMKPADRLAFEFPAVTYYYERQSERMAYLTLFPIGSVMRANLFGYRDLHDPWLRQLRERPQATLFASMPGLSKLTGPFEVAGPVKIRPVDLYVTNGHRQAGIVLVGDAFATSCPAAGTGARKVLTDVERLCNVYVPQWLATPAIGEDKIAAFYDDHVKRACDVHSLGKAYSLRAFSTDSGLRWRAQRTAKFVLQWSRGRLRQVARRPSAQTRVPQDAAVGRAVRPLVRLRGGGAAD
jgi:2-polyprenyl-6-methoxyphenol hydroxylase-like FAD-dependent oxidoreductase